MRDTISFYSILLYLTDEKLANIESNNTKSKVHISIHNRRTCKHFSSHCLVRISRRFMPEPSARSMGAILPARSEQAKDDTSEILAVAWYTRGRFLNILRIWGPVNRSYARDPVIFDSSWRHEK